FDPSSRAADYDPIRHLNAMFTEPAHLSAVADAASMLKDYGADLDDEIRHLTRQQEITNMQSIQRIQAAKTDMAELFHKIEDVQARAIQTEQTITEMTAEIKHLDSAKQNLTLSMTALKRLQMLTTAYEQLSAMSRTRQYAECAQLLQAVLQLTAHFKSYRSVDQVATLSRNVSDIQHELADQVCADFEAAFAKGELHARRSVLAEGCQVIDSLGDAARTRLITWYCNTQLREYRQIFRGNDEAGSLDNMSRRYAWLNRLLKVYDDEHAAIFPAAWKVNQVLVNTFCEGTREDFKEILARTGQSLRVDQLLACMQETLAFEHFLDRKLLGPSRRSIDTFASSAAAANEHALTQTISEAFEPYLNLWIADQDRQLASLIQQYKQRPLRQADEEFNPQSVITSSTELFTFYRHSLAQCAKLSTGSSLAELFRVFTKYLDQYAQQILAAYITERTGAPSLDLNAIVTVINTADYCSTTSSQLEERIKSRIDGQYRPQIDLQNQADAFLGIASSGVRLLVHSVETSLEPVWREMRNMPWAKLENVGDNSPYVILLLDNIRGRSEQILQVLQKPQYARAFADHLVEDASSLFINNVWQCRPVSEVAAEQMLLDAYTLKTGMSEIISPPPTGFTRRLNNSFQKVDNLLKVIQVRPVPPETLVQAYLLHIADKSEAYFRRVLDIKGIRSKTEQNQLIELFNVHRQASRYATSLQASNSTVAQLANPSTGAGTAAAPAAAASALAATAGSASIAHPPAAGLSSSSIASLGSVIASGVERLGSPVMGMSASLAPSMLTPTSAVFDQTPSSVPSGMASSAEATPGSTSGTGTGAASTGAGAGAEAAAGNLNANFRSLGKFFRR
ncbi:Vacuolar protein sorting-associated protein 53, partial [Ascosphaera acerosa]